MKYFLYCFVEEDYIDDAGFEEYAIYFSIGGMFIPKITRFIT